MNQDTAHTMSSSPSAGSRRASSSPGWLHTAFLNAGREAFGLVPDALPVATRHLLVAANGYGAESGGAAPLYSCPGEGPAALVEKLLPQLPQEFVGAAVDMIRMTLGECREPQQQTVARLCAVLAEIEAFRLLDGDRAADDVRSEMSVRIPALLQEFRASLLHGQDDRRMAEIGEAYFQVSLGACRVIPGAGEGQFAIELFAAGDFCVYILDRHGLAPLWCDRTGVLSPDTGGGLSCRRMELIHPEPFALLLLSGGLCHSARGLRHAGREGAGYIWRSRMQLEEQCLKVVTYATQEERLGSAAAEVFADRTTGVDSVSGALTLLYPGGASFDMFRHVCRGRLQDVQEMLALLPEEYDPDRAVLRGTLAQTEQTYVSDLFRTRPQLLEKTLDTLHRYILEKLAEALSHRDRGGLVPAEGTQKEDPAAADKADPDVPLLTSEMIYEVYRRFDKDNDADRAQIEQNRTALRQTLSQHWVTLRPVLCAVGCMTTAIRPADAEKADRMFCNCRDMNHRMDLMLCARRKKLSDVEQTLAAGLEVVRANRDDWLTGRGSRQGMAAWREKLCGPGETDLPALAEAMMTDWAEETEHFRRLQTAYTAEREILFAYDIDAGHGVFHDAFVGMMNGTLPSAVWDVYRRTLLGEEKLRDYAEMMEALRVISGRIAELNRAIEGRAAERKCVLALRRDFDWQVACLRASVYNDPRWGARVSDILDPGTRNGYLRMVRTWQETEALYARQAEVFHTYRRMYHAYVAE